MLELIIKGTGQEWITFLRWKDVLCVISVYISRLIKTLQKLVFAAMAQKKWLERIARQRMVVVVAVV